MTLTTPVSLSQLNEQSGTAALILPHMQCMLWSTQGVLCRACAVPCCGMPHCAVFCAVLCCAVCCVLCCAVLCCAVLCCAVLCCAVPCCAVLCCAVLCCAVLSCPVLYIVGLACLDAVWYPPIITCHDTMSHSDCQLPARRVLVMLNFTSIADTYAVVLPLLFLFGVPSPCAQGCLLHKDTKLQLNLSCTMTTIHVSEKLSAGRHGRHNHSMPSIAEMLCRAVMHRAGLSALFACSAPSLCASSCQLLLLPNMHLGFKS